MLKKELEDVATSILILDGRSNLKNDPIFACDIYTGIKPYLFKTIVCSSEKKTAKFSADFVKKMLSEIEKMYNKKVLAICTDNENKMNSMRSIAKKNYPILLIYECSVHILNLCVKEIMLSSVIKHILEEQKIF